MIIAERKRKETIAEYLLYMYQVEDLIRAHRFDLQSIEQQIINQFDLEYGKKREMLEWYKGLVDRMDEEGIKKQGHMRMLIDLVQDLDKLKCQIQIILHLDSD